MMLEQRGMWLVAGGVLGVAGWWCFWWCFPAEKGQQGAVVAASTNEEEEREKSLDILVRVSFYLVENEAQNTWLQIYPSKLTMVKLKLWLIR